jgi:RNA polymerase sigma-70 factor, ECF subfamily
MPAVRIAGVFLTSPKTIGQRPVRVKTKIRDGGIQFDIPELRDLPQRLDAVLDAIYAAFGIGGDDLVGVDGRSRELAEEIILVQVLPNEAEARGLLALMLHCELGGPRGGDLMADTFLFPSRIRNCGHFL